MKKKTLVANMTLCNDGEEHFFFQIEEGAETTNY